MFQLSDKLVDIRKFCQLRAEKANKLNELYQKGIVYKDLPDAFGEWQFDSGVASFDITNICYDLYKRYKSYNIVTICGDFFKVNDVLMRGIDNLVRGDEGLFTALSYGNSVGLKTLTVHSNFNNLEIYGIPTRGENWSATWLSKGNSVRIGNRLSGIIHSCVLRMLINQGYQRGFEVSIREVLGVKIVAEPSYDDDVTFMLMFRDGRVKTVPLLKVYRDLIVDTIVDAFGEHINSVTITNGGNRDFAAVCRMLDNSEYDLFLW